MIDTGTGEHMRGVRRTDEETHDLLESWKKFRLETRGTAGQWIELHGARYGLKAKGSLWAILADHPQYKARAIDNSWRGQPIDGRGAVHDDGRQVPMFRGADESDDPDEPPKPPPPRGTADRLTATHASLLARIRDLEEQLRVEKLVAECLVARIDDLKNKI